MKWEIRPLSAGLYLVSTPIGSARDITLRALDTLAAADILVAEDTRTLRKLMDIHGVPVSGRPVMSYHDHSGPGRRAQLIAALRAGKSLAYASEAGTPLLADPGFALARDAAAEGLSVTAVPGASALLAALCVAGQPTDRFTFLGFLPPASTQRRTVLSDWRTADTSLVVYEAPTRVKDLLGDMADCLGADRPISLCRELTKRFEEVRSGTIGTVLASVEADPPRGEIVLVAGHPLAEAEAPDLEAALTSALKTMRVKDAATAVAGAFGLPRRDVYQAALDLVSQEQGKARKGDEGDEDDG